MNIIKEYAGVNSVVTTNFFLIKINLFAIYFEALLSGILPESKLIV